MRSWERGSGDTVGTARRRDRGHGLMLDGTYRTFRESENAFRVPLPVRDAVRGVAATKLLVGEISLGVAGAPWRVVSRIAHSGSSQTPGSRYTGADPSCGVILLNSPRA